MVCRTSPEAPSILMQHISAHMLMFYNVCVPLHSGHVINNELCGRDMSTKRSEIIKYNLLFR